jgi:formyl-CoA transferase
VGVSIVDVATGATAHASILEALIARSRTGKGADIRISMFDVMADWLAVPLLNSEAGNPPKRMGLAHPSIAPYGVFRSRDGKDILISIQSEREWKKLCAEVLGQPDLPNDPRFANMLERVRNRQLTDTAVGDIFATLSRDDLLKRLSDADIAFAEVNTMTDLAVHPHLRRIEVDTPKGVVAYPAPAAIFVDQPRHYGAVPGIGEQIGEQADTPKAAPVRKSS